MVLTLGNLSVTPEFAACRRRTVERVSILRFKIGELTVVTR
jgi:hypothetical protein